jgi:hypothetical protein
MPVVNFIGQLAQLSPAPEPEERSDFREVPSTDRGNASYHDRGRFGTWAPSNEEGFRLPENVRRFEGYGCSEDDYERGYIPNVVHEDPAYDPGNYKNRWTIPKTPDEDDQPSTAGNDDLRFRAKNEMSRGMFNRPKIPTDR